VLFVRSNHKLAIMDLQRTNLVVSDTKRRIELRQCLQYWNLGCPDQQAIGIQMNTIPYSHVGIALSLPLFILNIWFLPEFFGSKIILGVND
jgi:hypothetical protein